MHMHLKGNCFIHISFARRPSALKINFHGNMLISTMLRKVFKANIVTNMAEQIARE